MIKRVKLFLGESHFATGELVVLTAAIIGTVILVMTTS